MHLYRKTRDDDCIYVRTRKRPLDGIKIALAKHRLTEWTLGINSSTTPAEIQGSYWLTPWSWTALTERFAYENQITSCPADVRQTYPVWRQDYTI